MKKQKNQKKRAVFLAVAVLLAFYMGWNTKVSEREALAARNFAVESSEKAKIIPDGAFVLMLIPEYPILKADNQSSTEIIAEVRDSSTGGICEDADGIEVKFSTTLGSMDADTVTMHNGRAVNIFYSQDLADVPRSATITAEIIDSDKFPELIGYMGIVNVTLSRPDIANTEENPSKSKISQKITYKSSAIRKGKVTYGSVFSLNAKAAGTGKLTYKSSNSKIISINANGRATVKGYGPVSIKIKASGGNGYKASVRKIKLTAVPGRGKVTKAVQENGVVRFQWRPEKTADGYEYAFAYNKKFSGQIRKRTSKTGLILTKYKTGTKKMYFRVRTYKKAGKKTCYGNWSRVRLLKLKKVCKAGESRAGTEENQNKRIMTGK